MVSTWETELQLECFAGSQVFYEFKPADEASWNPAGRVGVPGLEIAPRAKGCRLMQQSPACPGPEGAFTNNGRAAW